MPTYRSKNIERCNFFYLIVDLLSVSEEENGEADDRAAEEDVKLAQSIWAGKEIGDLLRYVSIKLHGWLSIIAVMMIITTATSMDRSDQRGSR